MTGDEIAVRIEAYEAAYAAARSAEADKDDARIRHEQAESDLRVAEQRVNNALNEWMAEARIRVKGEA